MRYILKNKESQAFLFESLSELAPQESVKILDETEKVFSLTYFIPLVNVVKEFHSRNKSIFTCNSGQRLGFKLIEKHQVIHCKEGEISGNLYEQE